MEFLDSVLTTFVYLLITLVLLALGRLVFSLFHRKINIKDELVEKDNLAFSVAHVGYFVGLICVIGGAMVGPSHGLLTDSIDIAVYGLLGIALLNITIRLNDLVILRKFKVRDEIIENQNVGTGVIEAASAIAAGLIIYGSISGEDEGGIISTILFWAAGQVLMIITSYVYNAIVPYNIHDYIEKNNVAVGIGFAGAIIAIGNLIRHAVTGEFEHWSDIWYHVAYDAAIALILLPIARILCDKLLLPGRNLTDELINQEKPNTGAAFIEAFSYIGGSMLIAWSLG